MPNVQNLPNLVLAVLDTTRADEAMQFDSLPAMRALATRGRVFTTAISPAPWTLPSHASLFSGMLPNEHGMTGDLVLAGGRLHSVGHRIEELSERWVPSLLSAAGYRTFAASANPWITERMGFAAGFDRFISTGPAVGNVRFDPTVKPRAPWVPAPIKSALRAGRSTVRAIRPTHTDAGAGASLAAFDAWRSSGQGAPFFAFFNFMEPHLPYAPPSAFAPRSIGRRIRSARLMRRLSNEFTLRYNVGLETLSDDVLGLLRELYRGEIQGLDAVLGRLIAMLPENTVLVVVGDHGENLGEHHLLGHQTSVADTLLHVPLVVAGPGIEPGVFDAPVSTAAVAGTLLAHAGLIGQPTVFDAVSDVRSFYESAYVEAAGARALADGPLADNADAVRALTTRAASARIGSRKLVVRSDGSRAVFDLQEDPAETRDLLPSNPALGSLFDEVDLPLEPPATAEVPAEQLAEIEAQLESLGYL